MPIFWKNKVLLAKTEATYGTDAVPTVGSNAILATNVKLNPMQGSDVARGLERPFFGAEGTIASELHAELSFEIELAPSGTVGTPPAWGPLLRACAMAQTISAGVSVAYNPITVNPESLTIYFWNGSTRYVMKGARGTAKFRIEANAIPKIAFQFLGLFSIPTEVAPGTPTYTQQTPQIGSTAFTPVATVNGQSFVVRSLELDMRNKLEGRFLIGSEAILITGRDEQIAMQVEAVPVSTFDPYTLARNATQVPIVITHGVGAGKIATINVPLAQMQRPEGLETPQDIVEWPLRLVPLPNAGNDQFTLTLT